MFKKACATLVSALLICSMALPVAAAAAGGEEADKTPAPDPIILIDSTEGDVCKAGDIMPYTMTLKTLDGTAYFVRLRLEPEGDIQHKFRFNTSSGWVDLSKSVFYDGSKIRPNIVVSADVPDGTYDVKVKIEYSSSTWERYSITDVIPVTVHGESDNALKLIGAAYKEDKITSDNKGTLVTSFKNDSGNTFSDVSISLNTQKTEGISLYKDFDPIYFSSIKSGETAKATFYTYVASSISTGNYPLYFDVSYRVGNGAAQTATLSIPTIINRSADVDGSGSTPRIIVEKYETDVDEIKAGQSFILDFTLKNTSSTTTVSNIKVVVGSVSSSSGASGSPTSAVFFPAEGSNSFFINSISPQGSVSNSIKLMANQSVEPGVYAVLLSLNYEDESGKPMPAAEEQISFNVTQEQRLEVQGLSIPTDVSGGSVPVSFQYINKGKATIYNLSVLVEGDFQMEGGSQYIGNLGAGANDYFDNVVSPMGEGMLNGEIVLQYEDSSGNQVENRTPFSCNVTPMDMNMGGFDDIPANLPQEPSGGMPWYVVVIIVVAVLAAATVVTFIVIKKKKAAKKVLVEDEDD